MMYEELVKNLRICSRCDFGQDCNGCTQKSDDAFCCDKLLHQAADAIEELLKAAKAMHTWMFLNSVDEQAAYDECGLTNEMNVALGYGGQFVAEMSKEES